MGFASSPNASRPAHTRISLCGDVMIGRGIDQVLPHPCDPHLYESHVTSALRYVELAELANGPILKPVHYSYLWGDALEEWQRARPDARIINLETAITRSEDPLPKGINFRMSPDNVSCLLAAEIDCCVVANNHVLDWGEDGLIDTLAVLHRQGIRTAGAGGSAIEAAAPAIIEVAEKKRVIIIALACPSSGVPASWAATEDKPGVNFLAELSEAAAEGVRQRIGEIRRPQDIVIASIHWGPNWGYGVPHEQRRFAHALIDQAGVSIVHGHSSHHAKAIEVYRGRLILYGCGDFLNDYEGIAGYEEFRDDLAVLNLADMDAGSGDLVGLELVPFQIRRFRLNRASSADTEWLRRTIDRESAKFGTRIERGRGTALRLSWDGEAKSRSRPTITR